MSLRLRVSRFDTIPGSYCTASVRSEPHPDSYFKAKVLTATLRGVSKTLVSAQKVVQGEMPQNIETFLEIRKEDDYGTVTPEYGSVSTFSFQFPDDPVLLHHHPDYLDWWRDSDTPTPQTLPPSGIFGPGNEIVYSIDVCLHDEISDSEIKARKEVAFTPTREPEASGSKALTVIKAIKTSVSADSCWKEEVVELALSSPQVMIPDQPIDLNIRSVRKTQAPTTTTLLPPAILLKSALVKLLINTSIQSSGNTKEEHSHKHNIARFSSIDSNDEAPSITPHGLSLAKLCHELKISPNFAASFATSNIQRNYALEILLVIEIGNNTFDVLFELGDVTLLGAELGSDGRDREMHESYDPDVHGIFVFDDDGNYLGKSYPGTEEQLQEFAE